MSNKTGWSIVETKATLRIFKGDLSITLTDNDEIMVSSRKVIKISPDNKQAKNVILSC